MGHQTTYGLFHFYVIMNGFYKRLICNTACIQIEHGHLHKLELTMILKKTGI